MADSSVVEEEQAPMHTIHVEAAEEDLEEMEPTAKALLAAMEELDTYLMLAEQIECLDQVGTELSQIIISPITLHFQAGHMVTVVVEHIMVIMALIHMDNMVEMES